MQLSEAIVKRMAELGWSATKLASALEDAKVNVHPLTVARWVNGESEPSGTYAIVLARVLGIDPTEIEPAALPLASGQ